MKTFGWLWNRPRLAILALACCFFIVNLCAADEPPSLKYKVFLVHGTFARNSPWYQEGGCFYEQLKIWANEKNITIDLIPFKWSGGLPASKRILAATELVEVFTREMHVEEQLCRDEREQPCKVVMIGHSHGGNVIFLATQLLALMQKNVAEAKGHFKMLLESCFRQEQEALAESEAIMRCFFESEIAVDEALTQVQPMSPEEIAIFTEEIFQKLSMNFVTRGEEAPAIPQIDEVYAMGTPIDTNIYFPAASVVKRVFSIFSEQDKIQIYATPFKHRFSEARGLATGTPANFIIDVQVTYSKSPNVVKAKHPKHLDLNTGFIGRWLLELASLIPARPTHGCCTLQNAWVHFFKDFSKPHPRII